MDGPALMAAGSPSSPLILVYADAANVLTRRAEPTERVPVLAMCTRGVERSRITPLEVGLARHDRQVPWIHTPPVWTGWPQATQRRVMAQVVNLHAHRERGVVLGLPCPSVRPDLSLDAVGEQAIPVMGESARPQPARLRPPTTIYAGPEALSRAARQANTLTHVNSSQQGLSTPGAVHAVPRHLHLTVRRCRRWGR